MKISKDLPGVESLHVYRCEDDIHVYRLEAPNDPFYLVIPMQNGPIPTCGQNGATVESLLDVAIDRLTQFQSGNFPCRANEQALVRLKEAKVFLDERTLDRLKRNVEGKEKA